MPEFGSEPVAAIAQRVHAAERSGFDSLHVGERADQALGAARLATDVQYGVAGTDFFQTARGLLAALVGDTTEATKQLSEVRNFSPDSSLGRLGCDLGPADVPSLESMCSR